MPGTLFLVATPIGNLEDITLRAIRVLKEVRLVAAEDTRRAAKLLAHYGIHTPTVSFHEHSHASKREGLVAKLVAGTDIALVSDAGTPSISDPGLELVRACLAAGVKVEPIPGPSAPLAAAIASGFPTERLTILGFAPPKAVARRNWLKEIGAIAGTVTFFESPNRIVALLSDAAEILGTRQMCVAREMSKVHEEFLVGSPASISAQLTNVRGEFTIVLGPVDEQESARPLPSDDEIAEVANGIGQKPDLSRRQYAALVAEQLGISANTAYAALERMKT